jgi:phage tail-like protein
MAIQRDHPYVQFNFLVDLGTGNTDIPQAGFQEVSINGMNMTYPEDRSANSKKTRITKITGINKSGDTIFKRGVISTPDLNQWLDQIRNGDKKSFRNVTIKLQNEDHTDVVQTWKLVRARITKHTSGPMKAKGTDVAMEELVLAYEKLEMKLTIRRAAD